ncbi:MAG: hypothetical protein V7K41_18220 [Nostoc sp.]
MTLSVLYLIAPSYLSDVSDNNSDAIADGRQNAIAGECIVGDRSYKIIN